MASTNPTWETEDVVPAPDVTNIAIPNIPEFPHALAPKGDATRVLVVIPTENKNKADLIKQVFNQNKPKDLELHYEKFKAGSDVGEQPYDLQTGLEGASNRIRNAQTVLSPEKAAAATTVILASIENYIQYHGEDGRSMQRPVDYGMIVMHNVSTKKTVVRITKGVTMPLVYVEEARKRGFEDIGRQHGCVTVGEVLKERDPGLDKANWHLVLAGKSRYDLLREAMLGMEIPW
jgi:non-canonical (house-cleaning) NTP pyrophosphatase